MTVTSPRTKSENSPNSMPTRSQRRQLYSEDMAALHELVQESIDKNSTNVAVLYDDGGVKSYVTYKELERRAISICEVLRSLGVNNETVGLCMPQNADLPSVILGILQTPGSFYPFDGDGPDFIRYSILKLSVRYLLVHIDLLQKVDELTHTLQGVVVPCMELLDLGLVLVSLPNITPPQQRLSLAYCITTSGTTSTPKVVRVPHNCIVQNITHLRNIFQTTRDDVCFLASPLTFDPSIVEMFVTLTSGATLLITSSEVKASPERLLDILHYRNKVSVLQMTPTMVMRFRSTVLRSTLLSSASSLRVLAVGGENFPSLDVFRTAVSPDCHTKFFNLYGITEVSTWATCFGFDTNHLRHNQEVPLGPVLAGTKVKVINIEGQEVKKGEGELLIGSENRVCLLNDETEADISDKMIWRNTGDTVCITEDGSITYIGRQDDQIKRHGKRLNMSAIEHAVQQLPSVADSRVIFSEQRLLLFLVAKEPSRNIQHAAFKMEVTSNLQNTFPAHYQPDELILIDVIPVTKHGKTDKKMLLSLWKNANSVRVFTPEDVHLWCQSIWKEYLNHLIEDQPIKGADEFLALGGDSLKAVNVVSCMETVTGFENTSLLDILLNRTFQDFVQEVNRLLTIQGGQTTGGTVESRDEDGAKSSTTIMGNGGVDKNMDRHEGVHKEVLSLEKNTPESNEQTTLVPGTNKLPTHFEEDLMIAEVSESFVGSVSRGSRYEGQISCEILLPRNPMEECQEDLSFKQLWKYDTGQCVDASPLIALSRTGSHIVYTGSHSHAMCAVDLTTGSEVWRTQLGDRVESSACLSHCGRWVVVGCYDNSVYVLCATSGAIKWKYQTEGCVKSSPTLDPVTSHIIIGSHDQCLHAVDIYKERCVWKCHLDTGSVFASPCVSRCHRHTYVSTLGSHLHAVNTENAYKSPKEDVYSIDLKPLQDSGSLVWSCVTDKPVFSSPAENQQCVVIGCVDGSVYSFTHHGQKIWTFQTQAPVFSSPTIATLPSQPNDVILMGSHDKHLYCVSITGVELWHWEADSPIYSTPFVVDLPKQISGATYFKTETSMAAAEATAENDITLNLQKASLEKKLHFQTEMSNGVTFASAKSDPAELTPITDCNCPHVKIHSHCVACSSRKTKSYLRDEEPCIKKQKYDSSILTDLEVDSEMKQDAVLKVRTVCSSLCSVCGKRRLHFCKTSSLEPFMINESSRLNIDRTDDSNTDHETGQRGLHCSLSDNFVLPTSVETKTAKDEQGIREKHGPDCENKSMKYCHCPKPSDKTLSDDRCFADDHSSNSRLVCVASTQGTLTVLDGATGQPVASTRLPGEVFSSPVVVGGLIVVGCRDDYIYCYRTT